MPLLRRPKLGSHLYWHGSTIRVEIRVPPSLQRFLGSTKLKESLKTSDARAAEALKWDVLKRLKKQIEDARKGIRTGTPDDPVVHEALLWRQAIEEDNSSGEPHDVSAREALSDRADVIEREHGERAARTFAGIATGTTTPLSSLVDDWIAEAQYKGRTEASRRHAIKLFRDWCVAAKLPTTIEAVTKKVAGRFITENFVKRAVPAATANKAISGLTSYWKWLGQRGHVEDSLNPWRAQNLKADKKPVTDDGHGAKRPFTDAEVKKLISGVRKQPLADLCTVAALTGCRISELADLRVSHVKEGSFRIVDGKTASAVREVPVHSQLAGIFAERCKGKKPDACIFHELIDQKSDARGRAAPASQAFTRERRRLKVDDRIKGARQSRIDFHSWRRWFIRKAVEALEQGATGFTAWTIADVVGHSKEDEPLPMTMGRYPGKAGLEARRACVQAVGLPSDSSINHEETPPAA